MWLCLPTVSAPMPFQMALDECLFESQKKDPQAPVLRFYSSSGPWISVGCSLRGQVGSGKGTGTIFQNKKWSQSPKRCLIPLASKSEIIRKNPAIPVTQRMTGGGCVLHGRDLIFSLVARYAGTGTPENSLCDAVQQGSPSPLSSVKTSYAEIHRGVKRGLQLCGLDPKFYSREDRLPKGKDCFDSPVESDLSWKGKKISGGAQKRSEGVLLHQESIVIPAGVMPEDLIAGIKQGLEAVFGLRIQNADLDPPMYFQAEKLIKD